MHGPSYFMSITGFSNGHQTSLWRIGKRVNELEREVVAHAHERIQTRILKDKQLAERIDKI